MTDTSSTTALDERMDLIKFGDAEKQALLAAKPAITAAREDDVSQLLGAMAQLKTRKNLHSRSGHSQEAA